MKINLYSLTKAYQYECRSLNITNLEFNIVSFLALVVFYLWMWAGPPPRRSFMTAFSVMCVFYRLCHPLQKSAIL